jgi:hypothetical protein
MVNIVCVLSINLRAYSYTTRYWGYRSTQAMTPCTGSATRIAAPVV